MLECVSDTGSFFTTGGGAAGFAAGRPAAGAGTRTGVVYSPPRETDFLERQWPARRAEEKFSGIPRRRKARRAVPAGNQMHARPGRTTLAAALHDLLELRAEERLFRHGDSYKRTAAPSHTAHRQGRA